MWGCVRPFRAISCAAACFWAATATAAPERVVSVNLCTDLLALELAAPGQLVSVSRLAQDPRSSAMHEVASQLPANGSGAEEVYLLRPDLVLAGTFTSPATVAMLEGLGIEVALFEPANALVDIPKRILQMGEALHQMPRAREMARRFETELAQLQETPEHRPRAALTYANSYSTGDKSLAGDILKAAGFDNVAAEIGLQNIGVVDLESLILLAPAVIIQGRGYPGISRAEDNLDHPALHALGKTQVFGDLIDRDWVCGTPRVLHAVRVLRALRLSLETVK